MIENLVSANLIKQEINEFRSSIENFNSKTTVQNKRMLQLTYVIAALTFVMSIAVGTQIYLSIKNEKYNPTQTEVSNTVLEKTDNKVLKNKIDYVVSFT